MPAAPTSAAPGASQARQDGPRDEGFDSVYEERAPQQSGRDRASDDAAIPRKHDAREAEEPKRTEGQPADGADRKEIGGDDVSATQADAGGAAGSPDVEVANETEAEGVETAAAEAPDASSVAVAEAPARQTRTPMPGDAEPPRTPRLTGERLPQAPAAEGEPPAESTEADAAIDPVAPGKTAQTPQTAEVQARAVSRPTETEEIQVRRFRLDGPDPAADGAEPRIDTPPRDTEVKAQGPTQIAVAPEAPARPVVDPTVHLAADPALTEVGGTEVRTTAEHVVRAEATVRHDTPRPVMQQVAEAARALRDGPVELMLQPEELGKVRMTLTAGADGSMTMSLQAERSETLDLLRRHIGDLARELQDLGFSNLSFSFGQDRAGAGQQHAGGPEGEGGERPAAAVPLSGPGLAARPNMAPATGGLDLRL